MRTLCHYASVQCLLNHLIRRSRENSPDQSLTPESQLGMQPSPQTPSLTQTLAELFSRLDRVLGKTPEDTPNSPPISTPGTDSTSHPPQSHFSTTDPESTSNLNLNLEVSTSPDTLQEQREDIPRPPLHSSTPGITSEPRPDFSAILNNESYIDKDRDRKSVV